MDQTTLLVIMIVFVSAACVALVVQAGLLFSIHKTSRSLHENVVRLSPKIEALIESSRAAIDEGRTSIRDVTARGNEILDITQKQLVRIDEMLADASTRTLRQLEHAEMVVDDAMSRAQQTVATVHSGVTRPLREISGLAAGLRAALHYLWRAGRPSPDSLTVDEEMFI